MSTIFYSFECDAYRLNPSKDPEAPFSIRDPDDKDMPRYLSRAMMFYELARPRRAYYLDERRLTQARQMYEDLRILAEAWCGKAYLLLDHTNGACCVGLDQVLHVEPVDREEADLFTGLLVKSASYSISSSKGSDRLNILINLDGVLRPAP